MVSKKIGLLRELSFLGGLVFHFNVLTSHCLSSGSVITLNKMKFNIYLYSRIPFV